MVPERFPLVKHHGLGVACVRRSRQNRTKARHHDRHPDWMRHMVTTIKALCISEDQDELACMGGLSYIGVGQPATHPVKAPMPATWYNRH
jgi:hypothetical protein